MSWKAIFSCSPLLPRHANSFFFLCRLTGDEALTITFLVSVIASISENTVDEKSYERKKRGKKVKQKCQKWTNSIHPAFNLKEATRLKSSPSIRACIHRSEKSVITRRRRWWRRENWRIKILLAWSFFQRRSRTSELLDERRRRNELNPEPQNIRMSSFIFNVLSHYYYCY